MRKALGYASLDQGREKRMQTGFVGLGAMGAHMARSLHRAGLLTGVWNRTAGKATALAQELECHAFTSLTELAGNCEAVVICVSADDDLRAVIAGLEPGLSPNMIVMDCSTVGAGTARQMHTALDALGVGFLDCPVSGGVEGARNATLAIMVGGDEPVFARAQPVLSALGKNRRLSRIERRRSGGEGHQSNHVRRHHPSRRRSDGLRARGRIAARSLDRAPGQGCGVELVLRQSRALHGAQRLSRGIFACGCTPRIYASAARWRHSTARNCRWSNRLSHNMRS